MSSHENPGVKGEEKKQGAGLAKASAGGASILIGLQIGSRALTFVVNQILLRYLSPELLGISTQLEVYSISALFFARESLRVAIQRQTDVGESHSKIDEKKALSKDHVFAETSAGKTQTIVNLSFISIILGIVSSITLGWAYLRVQDPVLHSVAYFETSLKIYGLAAIFELLSEPVFVVILQSLRFKIRARAESTATLLRCLATTSSAIWATRNGVDMGVLPFAIGQFVYAIALTAVYLLATTELADGKSKFSFLPTKIVSRDNSYIASYFSRPLLTLGISIFAQTLVKHILTQGDTLLIATLASPVIQGSYALASNYGGLLARLILQPVEESSRSYFGKLLNDKESRPSKALVETARDNLIAILRGYVMASLIAVSSGPTLAPILLRFVAGSRWESSGAGTVLGTYCYYIPLLAINGITESFVSAVATKSEINRQSTWMLAFSATFAASSFYFLAIKDMGAQGLVWANCINMAARIVWSSAFIGRYFKRNGVKVGLVGLRPQPLTIAASIGAWSLFTMIESAEYGSTSKVYVVVGSVIVQTIVIAVAEHDYIWARYLAFTGQEYYPLFPPEEKEEPYVVRVMGKDGKYVPLHELPPQQY